MNHAKLFSGRRAFFISGVIFLLLASFSVQAVLADNIPIFTDRNNNFSLERGSNLITWTSFDVTYDGTVHFNEYGKSFGLGGYLFFKNFNLPYDDLEIELFYYSMQDYGQNVPGTKEYILPIPYTYTPNDPDKPGGTGIYDFPVTITILPDHISLIRYEDLLSSNNFNVSLTEGETNQSVLKLTGLFNEKLGIRFEPSAFGNGGIIEWEDSPDGNYSLNKDENTEISIIYCTSDEKTGVKTPPGEYNYEFRLYFWTIIDEEEPAFKEYLQIPYHLTVLPKSSSVPEFPFVQAYAGGLAVLAAVFLLVMRGEL